MCNKVKFEPLRVKISHPKKETVKNLLTAILLLLISISISLFVFRENFLDLFRNRIPLGGDGLLTGLYIKCLENSNYLTLFFQNVSSSQYGWPGKLDFTSYPFGNTQELFLIKIFMDLTGINDPAQIIHIFSILKAAPISLATFILARTLGINRIISTLIGLIFAFNTFNLVRSEGHFLLALTWSLPLGLSAIFIAFNQVVSGKSPSKKNFWLGASLSLISFITGYYYSFFLIIFAFISVVFLFFLVMKENSGKSTISRIKKTIQRLYFPIFILFVYIIGLLIQTVPVLMRNLSQLNLTGVADRSVTESVIYSGTTESLFFDFYSFALRILNRSDLIAYMQTRISWESAQVGALSGAILVGAFVWLLRLGLKILITNSQGKNFERQTIDESLTFIIITLTSSLLLYFVSPINFMVSRFLPQIRAWGRLSVVISLLSLMLFGLFITKFPRKNVLNFSFVAILVLVPFFELNQFRQNRPPSISLNDVANTQNMQLKSTILNLKEEYSKNCALVNLPFYPFPEFDRSDDQNIDYGQLQLSILDDGYFRWSYGGIKATENFKVWQPLVSEFPPFARASIGDQIAYGKSVGACGALVDRSYLNKQEKIDLESLLANPLFCATELGGPLSENHARFVTVKFNDKSCNLKKDSKLEKLASDSLSNEIAWRVDQSSEIGFKNSFQMFSTSSPINARFRVSKLGSSSSLILQVKLVTANLAVNSTRKLTITSLENGNSQNYRINFDSSGYGRVELPNYFKHGNLERITISISSENANENGIWGIQLKSQH